MEPPLDPPLTPEEKYGIDDYNIRDRMEEKALAEYPPLEGMYEFYESLESPRAKKAFCVMELLEVLPDDGWASVKEGSIADLFTTWRDFKYLKACHALKKEEMYPVCYGVVERFFEDVIEPTEVDADDYTAENLTNPFDKLFREICNVFNDRNAYYDDYVEYFVENYIDYSETANELVEEAKEAREQAKIDAYLDDLHNNKDEY